MATQNPIEQEGTYPLPEAQLDRFFFKLVVGYCDRKQLASIVDRTTRGETIEPAKVMDGDGDRQVAGPDPRGDPGRSRARLRRAAGAGDASARPLRAALHEPIPALGRQPRAAQTLALAAKVRALLDGRYNVSFEDVRRVYLPAMRHRVIVNFEAQAEGVETDRVLLELLEKVPEKEE